MFIELFKIAEEAFKTGPNSVNHGDVKWFRKASEQGNAIAQYHLGLCYFEGEGVSKDDHEAYSWFALAAAQGDDQAHVLLDKLETELTPK